MRVEGVRRQQKIFQRLRAQLVDIPAVGAKHSKPQFFHCLLNYQAIKAN